MVDAAHDVDCGPDVGVAGIKLEESLQMHDAGPGLGVLRPHANLFVSAVPVVQHYSQLTHLKVIDGLANLKRLLGKRLCSIVIIAKSLIAVLEYR